MNKLLILCVVVTVASAASIDSDQNLLKRLLDILQETKRSTNYVSYSKANNQLTVSYVARVDASGVSHHRSVVTNDSGVTVGTFTSSAYQVNGNGVSNTYGLTLTTGTYEVEACEVNDDGSVAQCNTKSFNVV